MAHAIKQYVVRKLVLQGMLHDGKRSNQGGCVIKQYILIDMYTTDEMFYWLMLNRTLVLKGKQCTGSKNSKERINVQLCMNSNGTNILLPLIIRKYRS
jgi:hypothetical protein